MSEKTVITIDGPAGSGKSSVARLTAKKIGAVFLDTGSMYRAVTVAAIESGCGITDGAAVLEVFERTDFEFTPAPDGMKVLINRVDKTERIREPEITENVHYIASKEVLRQKLVQSQRDFARRYSRIITEGRDQGTVVFPDADYKFFLIADAAERAKRRAKELAEKNFEVDLQKLTRQIQARDESDSARLVGPLKPAADAVIIDTTNLRLNEVVEEILRYVDYRKV